jgi:hypothetical protein
MAYDRKTYDLARHFLFEAGGTENDIWALAQKLQDLGEAARDRVEEREDEDRYGGSMAHGMRAFTGGKYD